MGLRTPPSNPNVNVSTVSTSYAVSSAGDLIIICDASKLTSGRSFMSKLVDVPFLKLTMRHSAVAYCVGNNQVIASDVVKSGIFINPHSLVILAIGIKGLEAL
jgi:hypothetical protein